MDNITKSLKEALVMNYVPVEKHDQIVKDFLARADTRQLSTNPLRTTIDGDVLFVTNPED